jgi:hypothetical protein
VVLDRLERGDRATELDALLGVGGSLLGALAGEADGFGRQDHAGQVHQHPAGAGQHGGGGAVEGHPRGPPGGVHVGRRLDRDPLAHLDDGHVVAGRHEEQLREAAAEDGAGRPGRGVAVDGDRTAQGHRPGHRAVGQAGQVGLGDLAAHRGQHGAGDHRGHERAGRHRAPQRLHHHDQFLEPVPRPAVLLGDVQPEPPQPHQVVPERRQALLGRLEQRAGGAACVPPGQEVGGRAGQGPVVIGDGDRHGSTVRARSRSCW